MPHAIILYFDPATEARLDRIQETLLPLVEDPFYKGARPHISLTGFDESPPPELIPTLRNFAQSIAALELTLGSVGVFPGEQAVVFLSPVVTPTLLEVHNRLHTLLQPMNIQMNPYFLPGNWVPHSTMAMRMNPAAVPEAVMVCLQSGAFGSARLIELGLVQFPPVEEVALFPLSG
jgi:2'-5' RNA ligase